jgi:hypothetical protein
MAGRWKELHGKEFHKTHSSSNIKVIMLRKQIDHVARKAVKSPSKKEIKNKDVT